MKSEAWVTAMLIICVARIGFAAEHHLTPQQQLGRRLFEQSCGVCHTRPTLVSGMFGPELSKVNMGGREDLLQQIIANGTERMPGFKYNFSAEQIAAIAAYIKTLLPGTQDIPTARTTAKAPTPAQ